MGERFEIKYFSTTLGQGTRYGAHVVAGWLVWDTDREENAFGFMCDTKEEAAEWLPVAVGAQASEGARKRRRFARR